MEIVLLSLLALLGLVSLVGVSFFVGALLGYWYYRHYNDGTESSGKRARPLFRDCATACVLWFARRYFSYAVEDHRPLVVADDDDEPHPVMYACHPHGLFAVGTLCAAAELRDLTPCVHRLVFAVPLVRELALWFGCVDVSAASIGAQLDAGRSVMLVPGGCREMIRERNPSLDGEQRRTLQRDDRQLLGRTALVVGISLLSTLLYVLDVSDWRVLLGTQLAVWGAGAVQLLYYAHQNAVPEAGPYEIQTRHRGFLKLAYERRVAVVPVLHQGQEQIFRAYSLPRLDLLRAWVMDRVVGYPFPSLFLGPFPRRLRTHLYTPLRPRDYESVEAFTEQYYKTVREHYRLLCEKQQ
jgi:hypothetical protein